MDHPTSEEVYAALLSVQARILAVRAADDLGGLSEREWEIVLLALTHLHGAIVDEERGSEMVIRVIPAKRIAGSSSSDRAPSDPR